MGGGGVVLVVLSTHRNAIQLSIQATVNSALEAGLSRATWDGGLFV
jgi:hypothetical protein